MKNSDLPLQVPDYKLEHGSAGHDAPVKNYYKIDYVRH